MGSGSSRAFKILVPLEVRYVPHARADGGDHHEVAAHLVARGEGTFRFARVPGDPSPLSLQPPWLFFDAGSRRQAGRQARSMRILSYDFRSVVSELLHNFSKSQRNSVQSRDKKQNIAAE